MIPGQRVDEESSVAKMSLGTRYFEAHTGKVYYYVRANEALTAGSVVTPMVALFDGDCDVSSGAVLNDAAVTFAGNLVGSLVKINAGSNSVTDAPNEVSSFTANQLVLLNSWSEDLTTGEDYVVYNPWLVENCDAAGEVIVGVAPIAVTSGYYFWMQSGGYCDAVRVEGNTDAVVANEGLVSSAGAGVAKGLTAAGTTADEAEKANITALVPTALAAQTIPAVLKCLP